jgi:hypothetical protein
LRISGRIGRASLTALASCIALLAWGGIAQAETVTVGPPLGELERTELCPLTAGCGLVNLASATQSFAAASPVNGTVVRWTIKGASATPGYNITVLRANPGGTFTVTAASPLVAPAGAETETFAVDLPIQAGEYVELNLPDGGESGALEATPGTLGIFNSALAPGETRFPALELPTSNIAAYDALIDTTAAPVIALPVVTSPVVSPTPAPVEARCVVPKLNGKKLKAAKKKIKAADCKVGLISKKNGVKAATGKVVRQSPKAGKVLPAKTGVSVRLG